MPSTRKKVIVRKMNRDVLSGYVASSFIAGEELEILNTAGSVVVLTLADIKGVYFVREFHESELLPRKTFTARPRSEGLWVRLRFRDGETMEGLMLNDLAQISPAGFLLNPPDTRSNTQRIFVPRSAIMDLKVLAVIGAGGRSRKRPLADERQREMFGEEHSA